MKRFAIFINLYFLLILGASASGWENLWLRPDQQGFKSLASQHPRLAASQFKDPAWRAVAQYRSGDYQGAIETLSKQNSPEAHYNRGNALAHLHQYQAAIDAYQQTLKLQPDHHDAAHNLKVLQKLMQQHEREAKQNSSAASSSNENQQHASSQTQSTNSENANSSSNAPGDTSSAGNRPSPQNAQSDKTQTTTLNEMNTESHHQDSATEQWLRQIPDDPAGLLRRKFLRDHYRQQGEA